MYRGMSENSKCIS